jgi:hypothetical protein
MKRTVTTLCLVAGVLSFSSAFALDLQRKNLNPDNNRQHVSLNSSQAIFGCDNGNAFNAYFQETDQRFGNTFDFGTGAVLSEVVFAHFGFGFSGPYNYDLEIWDAASCTMVLAKNNLVAGDAANDIAVEDVLLCPDNLFVAGKMVVTIDPNSCLEPTDCYPDLLFDDQISIACPVIINSASVAPVCIDARDFNGPFLLQVATDQCPTPTKSHSWGQVKAIYR